MISGTILLDRKTFRETVLERDGGKCVVCKNSATSVHHIIDRKLFEDGGYYMNNGASLCDECHLKAENTLISCRELREKCKIEDIIYPDCLIKHECIIDYDKWGNPILDDCTRLKGDFYDERKIHKTLIYLYT